MAHQRALREAHGDDLDGNESAPYGLSVPANPRILQMRGRGKGTEGRGGEGSLELVQRNAGLEAGGGRPGRAPADQPDTDALPPGSVCTVSLGLSTRL